jgi:hypothetical protein
MEEALGLEIGFLGSKGALYCSRGCARQAGEIAARAVDADEYEALIESGELPAEALCPACGGEFAVAWPDREP